MTETILYFARANGFGQLDLETRGGNICAICLYEKYGFQKLCTCSHFFKIGEE